MALGRISALVSIRSSDLSTALVFGSVVCLSSAFFWLERWLCRSLEVV
jgi:hypothetical protein